jgi:dolichyl-diphosphooligosaccharide--protein glycosyltransferase
MAEWISSREPSPAEQRKKRKAEKRRGEPAQEVSRGILGEYRGLISYASSALAAIIVFFLAFHPLIGQTRALASDVYGPNEAWYSSLVWMRENTPDPFGDPDFYYALYEKPKAGEAYDYPESAYGVMSWWDYGHWITRIAHRIPNANPHQIGIGGRTENGSIIPGASTFMTAQNESAASPLLDVLGSKYVVIDVETDISKFHTMTTWAGDNPSTYFEQYYYQTENGSGSIMFYYPKYYQGMCSRLYNFECQAVIPNGSTLVISYTEVTVQGGEKVKVLTDIANNRPFATYEEAMAFINEHPGYIIVGWHPLISPVPLEKLGHYKLIHSSDQIVSLWDFINSRDIITSYVKIFEYTP